MLISYRDGRRRWGTVGVDGNTTAASWQALLDAVHYVLLDGPPGRVDDAPPLAAATG